MVQGMPQPDATTYQPTAAEQQAYMEMQARLVALLLRFDERGFGRHYGQRRGGAPDPQPLLRPYRDLAALTLLRDELFDDMLPRIVRRLSFESPRETMREEPPSRGRVDWERTLDATWAETPGEPPLLVHTRQRRRDFATPENLLTVAILLEYRGDLLGLLWDDQLVAHTDVLRHPLNAIVERCERELAFPQFAGIRGEAEQLLEAGELDALIHQVTERAIPGGNSAYSDLIDWRARLHGLALLQRTSVSDDTTLGADPRRDNYLFQLWIFYELAALLRDGAGSHGVTLSVWPMRLRFQWEGCTYELRHDQAVPLPVVSWAASPSRAHAVPGVRPDFYLWRVDPPLQQVRDDKLLVWREPGVVWDAKYYRERERPDAPAPPIKRMVADLALLGEEYGVLLFAFLKDMPKGEAGAYHLAPDRPRDQTVVPDQRVVVQQLRPSLSGAEAQLRERLTALLDDAHSRLGQPRVPRCHGLLIDALGSTAHGTLATAEGLLRRSGVPLVGGSAGSAQAALDDVVVCPKPHIGPWRVDLVSRSRDCCKNARVCHILGTGTAAELRPPERLTRLEDIAEAIRASEGDETDERRAGAATRQVLTVARRYADLIQPDLEEYKRWVRHELRVDERFETFPNLTDVHRDTLALGRFLWVQVEQIRAKNFAGPALLFTGVLEELVRLTVYARCPDLFDQRGRRLYRTLGTLGETRRLGGANWQTIVNAITQQQSWREIIAPERIFSFESWVAKVGEIAKIRNKAAHQAQIPEGEFRHLQDLYFGGPFAGVGVLTGLLLAWEPDQA